METDHSSNRPSSATSAGALDNGRKCISLKSSPHISSHVNTAAAGTSSAVSSAQSTPARRAFSSSDRSIIAEIRRSSEIFKSILLNLSIRDVEPPVTEVDANNKSEEPPTSKGDLDLESLIASHRQHRLANFQRDFSRMSTSSSSSSSSSSSTSSSSSNSASTAASSRCSSLDRLDLSSDYDEEHSIDGQTAGGGIVKRESSTIEHSSNLKINPNIAADKSADMNDIYRRQYLFTLPAIYLAVVRGNATAVYLLLRHGAKVNYQVSVRFFLCCHRYLIIEKQHINKTFDSHISYLCDHCRFQEAAIFRLIDILLVIVEIYNEIMRNITNGEKFF